MNYYKLIKKLRKIRDCLCEYVDESDKVFGYDLESAEYILDDAANAIEKLANKHFVDPRLNNGAWSCSKCGTGLTVNERYRDSFCPNCGRAIAWKKEDPDD